MMFWLVLLVAAIAGGVISIAIDAMEIRDMLKDFLNDKKPLPKGWVK